jgi:nitrile hydratase
VSEQDPSERAEILERRLEEHGHIHPEDVDAAIAAAESPSGNQPSAALGARVVARAWSDLDFRERLLVDTVNALEDYRRPSVPIAAVADTANVHHVIVCTLCSCYPSDLLGSAPTWYKSFEYRSRVVREPRAVLAEFGMFVADGVEIRVHDSTAEQRYLVLPLRPDGTEGWSEVQLAGLVTRNSMIGTGYPLAPD